MCRVLGGKYIYCNALLAIDRWDYTTTVMLYDLCDLKCRSSPLMLSAPDLCGHIISRQY
jgi:hypothetical protein